MSKNNSPDFCGVHLHAIEPHWDDVYAPRLAGFPVKVCYAEWIQAARPSIPAALIRLEKCNYK